MRTSFPSPRRFISAALIVALASALVAACNAHVETTCFDGVCPGETTGTGGNSGTGGAGGTGAGPQCTNDAESGDFPCDVFDILKASCLNCHNAAQDNGAPIDLLTCNRFHEKDCGIKFRRETAQNYVKTKFMPLGTMFPITDAQRKTLQDWLDNCAPCVPAGMGCTEMAGTLGCYKAMP